MNSLDAIESGIQHLLNDIKNISAKNFFFIIILNFLLIKTNKFIRIYQ